MRSLPPLQRWKTPLSQCCAEAVARSRRRTVSGQARPSGTANQTRWQSAQKTLQGDIGDFYAVKRREPGSPLWRDLRAARRKRRRQDDDDQDALRVDRTHVGGRLTGRCGRFTPLGSCPEARWIHVAEIFAVRRPHDRREPRFFRRSLRSAVGQPGATRRSGCCHCQDCKDAGI